MAKGFEDTLTAAQVELLAKAQDNPDVLNPAEVNEMARLQDRYQAYQQPEMSNKEAVWAIAKGAGNVAARALDLPGGIVRTAVGAAVDPFVDGDLVTGDDLLEALKGNAPTTATMMERGGAGEMGSVDLPILGRVTGRGTVGLLGDIASGLGASSALKAGVKAGGLLGKAASAMRAPEALVESGVKAAGKGIYRSGAKALDIVGDKFKKGRYGVSDTMLKYGIKGSPEQVKEQIRAVADRLAQQQQDIIQGANQLGATVDFKKVLAPVSREAGGLTKGINIIPVRNQAASAQTMLDDLIERGGYVPEKVIPAEAVQAPLFSSADEALSVPTKQMGAVADVPLKGVAVGQQTPLFPLEQLSTKVPENTLLEEIVNRGELPKVQQPLLTPLEGVPGPRPTVIPGKAAAGVADASKVKSQLYDQLKSDAFSDLSKDKAGAKLFKRAANRLKIAVEQSVDQVEPGAGAQLRETNRELGNFLTVMKKVDSEAAKDIMKNSVTQIDSSLAAMALADPSVLPAVAGKGIGKLLTSGGTRSRVGHLLATNNSVAPLLSQGLIGGLPGSDRGNQDDNIALTVERLKRKYGNNQ